MHIHFGFYLNKQDTDEQIDKIRNETKPVNNEDEDNPLLS